MLRVELDAPDDSLTLVALTMAIEGLDGVPLDNEGGVIPGTGVWRYQFPGGQLSVIVDPGLLAVEGADDLVQQVLDRMNADG